MRWVSSTDRHLRAAPCYEDSGFEHLRSTYSLHIPYPALLITLSIHPRWSFQAIPPLLLFTPYRLPSFPSSFDFSLFLFPFSFLYLFSYFKFRNNLSFFLFHFVYFWYTRCYAQSLSDFFVLLQFSFLDGWISSLQRNRRKSSFSSPSLSCDFFLISVPFPGFLYISANLIVAVSSMTKKHGIYQKKE